MLTREATAQVHTANVRTALGISRPDLVPDAHASPGEQEHSHLDCPFVHGAWFTVTGRILRVFA